MGLFFVFFGVAFGVQCQPNSIHILLSYINKNCVFNKTVILY